jgi:hypothetical protein
LLPLLQLDNETYVDAVRKTIIAADPASRVMCLVAYANLTPFLSAMYTVRGKTGDTKVPANLNEAIAFIAVAVDDAKHDEIAILRPMWFLTAALLMRASNMAQSGEPILSKIADIWLSLAEAGPYIKRLLEHNAIWDNSEKTWFDHIKDERDGVHYVLEFLAPKAAKRHQKLQPLKDRYRIYI